MTLKITLIWPHSQSHIQATKLAPKGPYENEKHAPEKPYMRGNAPICTHCTWYMLGTDADTQMTSQEAVQDQDKQYFWCFFDCFFFQSQKVEMP